MAKISKNYRVAFVFLIAMEFVSCAPRQSKVQLYQLGKLPIESVGTVFSKQTLVNSSVTYIRIEQKGFPISKPFPVIYFSDKTIEVNSFIQESNIVMPESDLPKIFALTRKLNCQTEPTKNDSMSIDVTSHQRNGVSYVCHVNIENACHYLHEIASEQYVHPTSYNLYSVVQLARDIHCPGTPPAPASLEPWPDVANG